MFFLTIFICSLVGALAIYNLIVVGVYDNPDRVFTVGGTYSSFLGLQNIFMSEEDSTELRLIAENITSDCKSERCKVYKVYKELSSFGYDMGTNTNSIEIWNEREGDCDEIANLALNLLRQVGIKGYVVCKTDHCWNVFHLERGIKVKIDIVQNKYEVIE